MSGAKIGEYARYYPVALMCLGLAIAVLWRRRFRGATLLAVAGLVAFAVLAFSHVPSGEDLWHSWASGRAWLEGRDPYVGAWLPNYPPYAVPLFGVAALLSFDAARAIWTVTIVAGAVALVPLAQAALLAGEGGEDRGALRLNGPEIAAFTAALALSLPIHFTLGLGQPTVFVTTCLVGALYARGRGWAVPAGLLLALAAVKPQTMIPFLVLFCRKKDWAALTTAGVSLAALWAVSSRPADWLPRLHEMFGNVSVLGSRGHINDFSNASGQAHSLLAFDRLLDCLGVGSRLAVRVGAALLQLGLAAGVALEVLRPGRLKPGAAVSLVALAAMLFIYHRTYDTPILVLPLVYSAARAIHGEARQRLPWLAAALAILLIWFVHPRAVEAIGLQAKGLGFTWLIVRAVLLPYNVWLLLLAIAAVAWAGRREAEHEPAGPEPVAALAARAGG